VHSGPRPQTGRSFLFGPPSQINSFSPRFLQVPRNSDPQSNPFLCRHAYPREPATNFLHGNRRFPLPVTFFPPPRSTVIEQLPPFFPPLPFIARTHSKAFYCYPLQATELPYQQQPFLPCGSSPQNLVRQRRIFWSCAVELCPCKSPRIYLLQTSGNLIWSLASRPQW